MKIALETVVVSTEGKPYETSETDKSPTTVGFLAYKAVLDCKATMEASGSVKYDRALLARKIQRTNELSIEDVKTIKDCTGEAYGAWIVAQIWDVLDPKPVVENDKE